MLQKMRVLLMVCFTAVLVACGGGGDDTPNFAGNYLINANLSSNSCGGSVPAASSGTDVVSQNGRAVSIVSAGLSLTGTVDADNGGFTAVNSQISSEVQVLSTLTFRTASSGSYAVKLTIGSSACAITYTGTAIKI